MGDGDDVLAWQVELRGDREVPVWNCGGIDYVDGSLTSHANPNLPSRERAKKIADNILSKAVDKLGLSPNTGITFHEVEAGGHHGGPKGEWVTYLLVGYNFRYRNRPIMGGCDVEARIGDNGKILRFAGNWINVKPWRTIEITLSPEDVLDNMGRYMGNHAKSEIGQESEIDNLVIKDMDFCYWSDYRVTGDKILEPVYRIEAIAEYKDGANSRLIFKMPVQKENSR